MATKPWGGAGAWAAEAEEAEAQAKAASNALPAESFPSLGETMVSSKTTKKKKPQTFSISEFTVGKYVGPGGKTREMNNSRGLSAEEMMMLPTGPRDRSTEEPESQGLGGGFRDYGGFRGGGDRMDRGDRDSRDRGFGGGFDRERDGGRGDRMGRDRDMDVRDDGPSRADEAGSWGANKKSLPAGGGGGGGGYQSALGGSMGRGGYDDDTRERGRMSDRDLPSRADEVENWGSSKKFVPSAPLGGGGGDSFDRRGPRGGGGGGFEDAPRRGGGGGFDDAPGGISRADEVDNWGAAKKFVPSSAPPPERRGGGFESTYRDAGSEADRWARREPPPAGDDVPRPAERPRLVLQPRSIPVDSPLPPLLPVDRNGENERPHSSHSTRSDRSLSLRDDTAAPDGLPVPKPRTRSNPFGAARPREEVLAEKGHDWRKIDAELEMKRPSSSHSNRSSRPQTPEVGSGGEGVPRSRPKVNPFGEARPRDASVERDLVSRDWRKPSVAEVVVVDRPETEQAESALEEDSTTTPTITTTTTTEQVES